MPTTATATDTLPLVDHDALAALADLAIGEHAAVFGAPGSGKTTLSVELLADAVERRGLATTQVLALSATRTTATALRDRLAVRLGVTTRGALARTANSLAFEAVRAHLGVPATLLTGAEHDRIIADLLESGVRDGCGPAWPAPFDDDVRMLRGFRAELRDLLMRAVAHGLDGAGLSALGRAAGREEWVAAGAFLDEYLEVKEQVRPTQFDSSELGAFAAAVVRESAGDERASTRIGPLADLRLIVVDDAQEATEATAALLGAFAARGTSIVVIGDPDVASNGFRGGRPELLGSLGGVVGAPVRRIELDRVHRGRPELRELVRTVSGRIGTALGGTHRSAGLVETSAALPSALPSALPAVVGIDAPSQTAEAQAVATHLRERHLLDGVPWSRMAVVLRSGSNVQAFERTLVRCEVPTGATGSRTALREHAGAAALLTVASWALGRESLTPELAVSVLTGPIGRLDAVGLRRLRLALRHDELANGGSRAADDLLVEALDAPGGFETIDAPQARRAARVTKLVTAARAVAAGGGTVEEVLWAVWSGSGLAEEWSAQAAAPGAVGDEANRALDVVVALFAAAQRFVEREPDAPAIRFVEEMLAQELPEDSLAPQRVAEHVAVVTPAGLVGRELDVVVVARLQDGVFPNLRPRGSLLQAGMLAPAVRAAVAGLPMPTVDTVAQARAAVRDDELRLFALAVSRATRQVVLSCTSDDDQQPSPLMGYATERLHASRRRPLHLRGMVGALRREAVAAARHGSEGGEAAAALALLAEQGVPGAHPDDWYGLAEPSTTAPLVDLDGDPDAVVGISPSQIDRIEESPLGWFVDHVASPPSGVAAAIGTIVHAVVEAAAGADGDIGVEQLWSDVEAQFARLPFEAGWVAERERRGARRMAEGAGDYLAHFRDDGKVLLGAEGRFTLVTGRARLTGTVDRVEASPDGTTVVVDLKTGRTPPTGEQTRTHAQLAAYQIAARDGVLPNAGIVGGAKLVYLARPLSGAAFTERAQQPFDDEADAAFRARLDEVARIVAGSEFTAPADPGYRSRFGGWQYRVHLVPAVSA